MALNTSGNWEVGDDLRVLEALGLPFSQYTLDCLWTCMAQLESTMETAVARVRSLLTDYESARAAQKLSQLADTEGKVLVEADVLKWEVTGGSAGLQNEIMSIQGDLAAYFSFCPCIPSPEAFSGGITSLIRS